MYDYDHYFNNDWYKNIEIPDDKGCYGVNEIITENTLKQLKKIIESDNNLNIFFQSGMDHTSSIEYLKYFISFIENNPVIDSLIFFDTININIFFNSYVKKDDKNNIDSLHLFHNTLMIDKIFYVDHKKKIYYYHFKYYLEELVKLSIKHKIINEEINIDSLLSFETHIATFTKGPEDLRDPEKNYNKLKINIFCQNKKLIKKYFERFNFQDLIVDYPEYYDNLIELLTKTEISIIKNYIKIFIVNFFSSIINNEFYDIYHYFYRTTLKGIPKKEEKWIRMVNYTSIFFSNRLGYLYCQKNKSDTSMDILYYILDSIITQFKKNILSINWMSQNTKNKVFKKINNIKFELGLPNKNYIPNVKLTNDFMRNILLLERDRYILNKFRKIDYELHKPPSYGLNAYYDIAENKIVLLKGILQNPYYVEPKTLKDVIKNYAGIGFVIGHELFHGFDNQGSHYDENGKLNSIMDKETRDKYELFLKKYRERNKLSVGESVSDYYGLKTALFALKNALEINDIQMDITHYKTFFSNFSHGFRSKMRISYINYKSITDEHPDNKMRINTVINDILEEYNIKII